jgi:hypothetical protein
VAGDWDGVHYPDDLTIPFCFIPDGAPEPTEWLARYPDHIRMPATFIPDPPRQADPPPPAVPGGALAASAAAAIPFSAWAPPRLAVMEAGEFLAGVGGILAFLGIMWPTATAPREMDERPPPGGLVPH